MPVRLTTNRGVNRFVWNLRYDPPRTVPGVLLFWHSPIYPPVGPIALPGTYTLELTVDGRTFSAPLEVSADDRIEADPDALRAQFDLLISLRDRFSRLSEQLVELDATRKQLEALAQRLAPMLVYLNKLDGRLQQCHFPASDPLVTTTRESCEKLRQLLAAIHVLAATSQDDSGYFVGYEWRRRKDERRNQ